MDQVLIDQLQQLMQPNDEINLTGTPATQEEIDNAEKILGVQFHEDYTSFILRFGGAYGGIPIHAFNNNEMFSKETVIDLTQTFREDYEDDPRSSIINQSYVISVDGSGNPVMIDHTGQVIIFYHDNDEHRILAPSLSQLIRDIFSGKLENEF